MRKNASVCAKQTARNAIKEADPDLVNSFESRLISFISSTEIWTCFETRYYTDHCHALILRLANQRAWGCVAQKRVSQAFDSRALPLLSAGKQNKISERR